MDRSAPTAPLTRLSAPAPAAHRPAAGHGEPLWRELAGQVLRSERIETGRTLQQVAERAGVSPQYLSEVERGRKDPSSEMLESICGALGLRLADLLGASGRMLAGRSRYSPVGPHSPAVRRPAGAGPQAAIVSLAA